MRASTERALGNIAFLRDVKASTLVEISRNCRWVELERDEVLISAGEHLDKVFFLLSGELRFLLYTRSGKLVSLQGATEGSLVGEAVLADATWLPYSVEAAKTSTIALVNAQAFLRLVERDRDLLHAVMRCMIERQQLLTEQIVELSTLGVHARIHNALLRLCSGSTNADGSATISPIPTHSDIARRVGTQREAVSREMSHLQQAGIVVRGEGSLFIPDVARLA